MDWLRMNTNHLRDGHSDAKTRPTTGDAVQDPMHGYSGKATRTVSSHRKRDLLLSYGLDWILSIAIWAVFYALDKVDGYRRLFSITDTSLRHPHAENERVPVWALILIGGIFPLLIILLWAGVFRRSFYDTQTGILGLILSLGISQVFTNIIKITVGRPRPDIINRCQPPTDLVANPQFGLTSWTVCTRTDLLKDGFRSFPSGHASFAWAGLWYMTLFVAGKMCIWDRKGYTLKSWLLLIPVVAASLVAISRTMDYRHHATDIIAGSILGILVAWYAYRQYYPALDNALSFRPYPPRIPRESEPQEPTLSDVEIGNVFHQGPPMTSHSNHSRRQQQQQHQAFSQRHARSPSEAEGLVAPPVLPATVHDHQHHGQQHGSHHHHSRNKTRDSVSYPSVDSSVQGSTNAVGTMEPGYPNDGSAGYGYDARDPAVRVDSKSHGLPRY